MNCGKRNRKIDVRFTKDEYQLILELEKTLGVRKTDLVRGRRLQDAPTVVNAKELIGILDGLGAEMADAVTILTNWQNIPISLE